MAGGVVVSADSRTPVAGATVAVFTRDGEVIDTDQTDENGQWAVEIGWQDAKLNSPPKGRGLFSSIVGAVTWPVRTAATMVGVPAKAAVKSAARAAGGAAVAGAGVAAAASGGPVAVAAASKAGETVGRYAAGQVVGNEEDLAQKRRAERAAQLLVRVWKPGFKDYTGLAGVYLVDQVQQQKGQPFNLAYVDAVELAAQTAKENSTAPETFGVFKQVLAEPGICEGGLTVKVTAEMPVPPEVQDEVRMVGKDLTTGQTFAVPPSHGDWWEGYLPLSEKGPFRNHQITLVAYRQPQPDKQRDEDTERAIDKKGAWDQRKDFPVDPALLACRDRGAVLITVTRPPKKAKH